MKVEVEPDDPRTTPLGTSLTSHSNGQSPIAVFGAAVASQHMNPGGDMKVTLIVPFDQVPNVMPVMRYVGGVTFEVTIRRVPMDELPEPGW